VTEPTPIPQRVSDEDIRELLERRKAGKMTGVRPSIEAVESMLVEVEMYRLRARCQLRRQRDAAHGRSGCAPRGVREGIEPPNPLIKRHTGVGGMRNGTD
jgi:hypothetical protein